MEVGFENYVYRHGVRGRTRYSVTTITVKVWKIKHHNKLIYVRERLRKAVITVIPKYMRNGRKYACLVSQRIQKITHLSCLRNYYEA